jgi:magnesium transporter
MPELDWTFDDPFAVAVIITSGVLPLIWFWKADGLDEGA